MALIMPLHAVPQGSIWKELKRPKDREVLNHSPREERRVSLKQFQTQKSSPFDPLNSFLWQIPECLLPETFHPLFHSHQKALTKHPFTSWKHQRWGGVGRLIHTYGPHNLEIYNQRCKHM